MKMKICFAASSGGHLEEMKGLKPIMEKNDSFFLTEQCSFSDNKICEKVYYVPQINRRELLFIFKFLHNFLRSYKILLREKPDYIITTGALATYPICLLGKIMKKKIIYIESFARIDGPSLTGRMMYKIADLFIVQWEELLEYFPKAVYGGGIF